MKRPIFFAYLIALHLVLAGLLLKLGALDIVRHWLRGTHASKPHFERTVGMHGTMDPFVPAGSAIFLGDSITQGLAAVAVAPQTINYGIAGLMSADLLNSLPVYRSLPRARVIFLMIGINDVGRGASLGLGERLRQIVEALPREVPLVWSAVMPTLRPRDRLGIEQANAAIKALCGARPNCVFVDTHRLLRGGDSTFYADQVHLNAAGYAVWIDALRSANLNLPHDNQRARAPSRTP